MRIFLAADGAAGLKSARLISRAGHVLVGVAAPATVANQPLASFAEGNAAEVFPGTTVKDPAFAGWLSTNKTDVLLSVHTSHIVHPQVLSAAAAGAFNLHPGPLPAYAGRNPVSWAIFNGETRHAATLHWMDPEIDAGPVVAINEVEIAPGDTALDLMAKTSNAGLVAVRHLLEDLAAGREISSMPQNAEARRYFSAKNIPLDGLATWNFPADRIGRYIRANNFGPFPSPWPKPRLRIDGRDMIVVDVDLGSPTGGVPAGTVEGSRVAASDFWLRCSVREPQE